MNNKVIFIPLIIYLFLDVLELYTKESYSCVKIVLFVVIILLGIYFKIFYKKKWAFYFTCKTRFHNTINGYAGATAIMVKCCDAAAIAYEDGVN